MAQADNFSKAACYLQSLLYPLNED